jgi:hypothetical protein
MRFAADHDGQWFAFLDLVALFVVAEPDAELSAAEA